MDVSVSPPTSSPDATTAPPTTEVAVTGEVLPAFEFESRFGLRPVAASLDAGLEGFPTLGQVFVPANGERGQVVTASASSDGERLLAVVDGLVPLEGSSDEVFTATAPEGYVTILVHRPETDVLITIHAQGYSRDDVVEIAESAQILETPR